MAPSVKAKPANARHRTKPAIPDPYAENFAADYDLFYEGKPYKQEAEFIHQRLREFGQKAPGRLLELACGTGGHAIRLAKLGYLVTATDISGAMIKRAQAKARTMKITIKQQDMRELPAPETPFDVAVCLFDSIGYAKTDEAIASVLDGVHNNLRPNGFFVFEYWHAPAMLSHFDPIRIRQFRGDDATILRVSETELEPHHSLAHVTYSIYKLRSDLTYTHTVERHTNRYFSMQEMEDRARRHGFEPLAAYAGFQTARPITSDTWHIVAIWKRAGKRQFDE